MTAAADLRRFGGRGTEAEGRSSRPSLAMNGLPWIPMQASTEGRQTGE